MHRSQLAGFIIDCQGPDLERAATFWSQALGYPMRRSSADEDAGYVPLETGDEGLHIEVQAVTHPSRVHLDIESDDIDAEADRLEALGAKRLRKVRSWWVMEAPTGQRFCVIEARREIFKRTAHEWP